VSVCFCRFFLHVPYTYTVALEKLSLHSLHKRTHGLDALFFSCLCGIKSFTFLLKNVSLRVPTSNIRDFSLFGVCPSARCAYAANVVGKYLDVFAVGAVSLNHIYTHQTKIVNNIWSQS
jgi:hypothetical protein